MIANTLEYLGGIPRDSNPLNIIVMKADEDEEHTRYCDVEEIISDPDGIKDEVQRLKKDFGEYGDELVKGITEHYSGPLLQKI